MGIYSLEILTHLFVIKLFLLANFSYLLQTSAIFSFQSTVATILLTSAQIYTKYTVIKSYI